MSRALRRLYALLGGRHNVDCLSPKLQVTHLEDGESRVDRAPHLGRILSDPTTKNHTTSHRHFHGTFKTYAMSGIGSGPLLRTSSASAATAASSRSLPVQTFQPKCEAAIWSS